MEIRPARVVRRGSSFMRTISMGIKRSRQTDKVYEILKRPDGLFDIYHNGELTNRLIPERWLEDQLAQHGICGQEYRGARCKLDSLGEARLVFQTGRIKTKLRTKDDSTVKLEGI